MSNFKLSFGLGAILVPLVVPFADQLCFARPRNDPPSDN